MEAILTKFRAFEPTRRDLRKALAKLDRAEIARRQVLIRVRRVNAEQLKSCNRLLAQQEVA